MDGEPTPSGGTGAVHLAPVTWDDVYRTHRNQLVRLAYLITGSQAVAEDLVQDTFIRVMAKIRPDANPGPYLRRSVVNACYSWHRRSWREVRPRSDSQADGPPTGGSPGFRSSGYGSSGRGSVSHGSYGGLSPYEGTSVEMWDVLARLAPRRRTILVLRYYLDMSEADVAATLGCRVGTVKSTTHRALAELKRMLER